MFEKCVLNANTPLFIQFPFSEELFEFTDSSGPLWEGRVFSCPFFAFNTHSPRWRRIGTSVSMLPSWFFLILTSCTLSFPNLESALLGGYRGPGVGFCETRGHFSPPGLRQSHRSWPPMTYPLSSLPSLKCFQNFLFYECSAILS